MANNAYLINSSIRSNSIEELQEKNNNFEILATGSNRIPVPWFFCFDEGDLKSAEFNYEEDDGEKVSFKFQAPCCLLYTSPSPRDLSTSRMPSSA